LLISVAFAVLAAASNALASVLQRRAARTAPVDQAFRLGLIAYLIRRPSWLGGIGALIGGFLFQATALNFGELSLVQPVLVMELPFTLVFIGLILKFRTDGQSWRAVGLLTVGLVVLLLAAGPSEGHRVPHDVGWTIAVFVTVGLLAALLAAALVLPGVGRAVLLGASAGLGFAFTAALMKEAVTELREQPAALLTTWPLYGMVLAGLISLFLLQNALQSGTLVAVQPALTISDPIASIGYGVGLFGETIRLGPWVLPELAGIGLIVYGSLRLAQSPPLRRQRVSSAER
jgi:drug/metabolite transporter (DMT)-like permease